MRTRAGSVGQDQRETCKPLMSSRSGSATPYPVSLRILIAQSLLVLCLDSKATPVCV
jgi:hypothetical protein